MIGVIYRRMLHLGIMLAASSVVIFAVMRIIPGDPAMIYAGPEATPEAINAIRARFGLDEPLLVQYWIWLKGAVTGDFGMSFSTGDTVAEVVLTSLLPTLELALAAVFVAVLVGSTLGLLAGLSPNSLTDRLVQGFNSLAMGVPNFWFAILLLLSFSLYFEWLPSGGRVAFSDDPLAWGRHLIMPTLALSLRPSGIVSRFVRSSIIGVSNSDYMRTARSVGIEPGRMLRRYALPNATPPILTIVGIEFGRLVGGAVVIESVFAWPGLGRVTLQAIQFRDYAVVQGAIAVVVVLVLLVNLIVDIAHPLIDPRVESET